MQTTRLFVSSQSRLLVLIAALVYVLSQAALLQHSHDGDLNLDPDCQLCLKLGSHSDGIIVVSLVPQVEVVSSDYQVLDLDPLLTTSLAPRSRAPPQTA